ncbi:hypothetical protein HNR19_002996 [Nocardioides thalensis]|uniref:Uncharacterized protein n=1 Tax=Nocardioides thalensis TaxID=1914755 RepID=A0A853C743_9ACTN|nr:hypothetical protein [Nocardioides thalensis]NYJ02298.1 hypothetical protein [Nocardioides thalensis]
MNEHDLTALLERSTEDLAPDVERLLAAGVARGRSSLRRRRVALSLGTAAAVATALAAGVTLLPSGSEPTIAEDLTVATAPAAGQRDLASLDVIRDRLAAVLPEGEVTDVSVAEPVEDGPATVELTLEDAVVVAELYDDTPPPADSVPDPGPRPEGCTRAMLTEGSPTNAQMNDPVFRACSAWRTDHEYFTCAQSEACWANRHAPHCTRPQPFPTCTQLADGSWVSTNDYASPGEELGELHTWADIVTTDHWWITVSSTQPGDPDRDTPLLGHDDLVALVTSDIWFE